MSISKKNTSFYKRKYTLLYKLFIILCNRASQKTNGYKYYSFGCCSLGFRSKKGFLEEALTGMANTCLQPSKMFKRWAARPAENITRVSTDDQQP